MHINLKLVITLQRAAAGQQLQRGTGREGDGDGEYKTLPDTQETQAEDTTQLLPALFGPTTRRRDPLPASAAPPASARSQLKNLCAY